MKTIFKHLRTPCVSVTLILSLLLCACQETPETQAVVSKNDGAFDAAAAETAAATQAEQQTQSAALSETFTSTDGSVSFSVDVKASVPETAMPIVQVSPHYLTSEDAQRVFSALFGDAVAYQGRDMLDTDSYTKSELQEMINRWAPYTSAEAVCSLMGEGYEDVADTVSSFIEQYTVKLESASDTARAQCNWTYQTTDYEVSEITAETTVDGVSYTFGVSTKNGSDYKLNNIFVYLLDRGPAQLDTAIYNAQLCRTAEPTETELEALRQKAAQMLANMELGDWEVDAVSYTKHETGGDPEYFVTVTAVPVFEGEAALRMQQLTNLKSDDSYASNYYLTDASFTFSADGKLVAFSLYSPVDVQTVVNENTQLLSLDELYGYVKNNLSLRDSAYYGKDIYWGASEETSVDVTVSDMTFALARTKVPNTDDSYYYVPALRVSGSMTATGKDSGSVYWEMAEGSTLLLLNAVDGSVIEQ